MNEIDYTDGLWGWSPIAKLIAIAMGRLFR